MGPHPLGTHASGALKSQVTRRSALALAGLLPTVLSSGSLAAQDDSYPSREIHIVCAFPAGSGADVWVRFFVEQIRPMVPKPIIVENKTGANGNIAAEYVARARPDGYTILSHSPTALAANRYLFKNQPIDIRSTLVNVATMIEFAFYLTVDAKRPWNSLQDVVAYARERGDKATFSSTAATGRVLGHLLNQTFGLQATEVQYRTAADGLNDILSGAVDYAISDGVFAHAQAREGRLKIIGAGVKQRMKSDPDVPTLIEQGAPGVYAPGFFGVMVPTGTPRAINEKINQWYGAALRSKTTLDFVDKFGADPLATSLDEAEQMFTDTIVDWGDLVKRSKIEPQG
jgi:tripartite-type tricarboxylate transporter receptor subunit TctC